MAARKLTTGLTGLAVADRPLIKLTVLYGKIMKTLSAMPETAGYRKHTEQIVKNRLAIVESESDIPKLEKKLNAGQIEEVIEQAKSELNLARKMAEWKPWEPLVQEAPKNQWKWPIV